MCGIAGYISKQDFPPKVIKSMVQALYHRGPDEDGFYEDQPFCGGMRRLSINGLKNGSQPFYGVSGNSVLFYNGEIYNAPALRKFLQKEHGIQCQTDCDGEVIAHLYDVLGPKAFEKLDGMFAAAIWLRNEKKLILARDIAGEKPLYYSICSSGNFIFSSDLRSLLRHPSISKDISLQALWDIPTFLWVPEPQTIYNDVFVLPRSHYLVFDGQNLAITPYSNCFDKVKAEHSDSWEDLVHKTKAVVMDAVHSRLLSDVPLGAFLSSGLDSSIVTTLAQKELGNLQTFSIGFDRHEEDPYDGYADESQEAADYAKKIGTKHHIVRVTQKDFKDALPDFVAHNGQPNAVSSGLGVMQIAKQAREIGLKVLLSGDGADELFGGYGWYTLLGSDILDRAPQDTETPDISLHDNALSKSELLSNIAEHPYPKRAWAWHYYASETKKSRLFNDNLIPEIDSSLRIFGAFKNTSEPWNAMDYIAQDRECYLPNEMMTKVDRMTMAHSIEGRPPFVAPAILNFVKGLSYPHMVKDGVLKPLLREAFRDLLPASIIDRPKHGFRVPIDAWLKGEWSDLVKQTFAPSSALNRAGYLSAEAENYALSMVNSTKRINGHSIFAFIVMNLWLESQTSNS